VIAGIDLRIGVAELTVIFSAGSTIRNRSTRNGKVSSEEEAGQGQR